MEKGDETTAMELQKVVRNKVMMPHCYHFHDGNKVNQRSKRRDTLILVKKMVVKMNLMMSSILIDDV